MYYGYVCFFFFKQKTAYEMRISDWSSDVCSSDLGHRQNVEAAVAVEHVDDAVLIHVDVVGLRARLAADRLRNEGADLLRREGIVDVDDAQRSEEHTSELQSLMRISYAVFCLKKNKTHAI